MLTRVVELSTRPAELAGTKFRRVFFYVKRTDGNLFPNLLSFADNDNLPVEYCYYSKGHLKLVFLFRSAFINYGPGQIWPFAVLASVSILKSLLSLKIVNI